MARQPQPAGRLAIFALSIIAGISALVAIHLLRASLQEGLETQAKALLGADLHLSAREPIPPEAEARLMQEASRSARELSFSSMLYFAGADAARLVQVRGLSGEYPFFGKVETSPAGQWARLAEGPGILVEPALLDQFHARVGDKVKLGALEVAHSRHGDQAAAAQRAFWRLRAGGIRAAERSGADGAAGPHQPGAASLVPGAAPAGRGAGAREAYMSTGWKFETPEDRREALGNALDNAQQFLGLVALAALVLGAIGVAGAVHAHIARRTASIAILRCLGCPGEAAFGIYFAQAASLAVLGALAGAAVGVGLHGAVLAYYRESFPVQIETAPSWRVVVETTLAGLAVCAGFALMPLLRVRAIPPAAALREGAAAAAGVLRAWPVWLGLVLLLTGLNVRHGSHWGRALAMTAAQGVAFLVLAGVARLLAAGARRLARPAWPYLLRQGIANLHRPRNQTLLFLLSLGLGTFLLVTVLLAKNLLLERTSVQRLAESPNVYLVDVQEDQVAGVKQLLEGLHLPALESAPLITMRIASIRGKPVRELEKTGAMPKWVLQREFRSTWRAELNATEKVVAGQWVSAVPPGEGPVPLSLEADIAKDLHVAVGDEMELDVQGVPIRTRVTSLREVDWSRFNLNFFMVFPPGALEGAPGFDVITTRVPEGSSSGELQRVLVKQYPNVSAIDLASILETVRNVLSKVARIVSVLAGFTVLAALPILIGTLLNGRDQRLKESVLLRTLGASARQVRIILTVEYVTLGTLSGLTGVLLAVAANAALAHWVFEASPWPQPGVLAGAFGSTILISLLAGLALSRGVSRHPPLEILRGVG